MSDWRSMLKGYPIDWLLEEENPSVRYFALTGLLGKPQDDTGVIRARNRIMETRPVPRILAKQEAGGYWGVASDFYVKSKYKGTVWTLIILAELGADKEHEGVQKACEFILQNSQDPESGGFAYYSARAGGGDHGKLLPCLTGNMVWSLLRLGYVDDPRVRHGIDWITRYQRFDDGAAEAPAGWPYDKREPCWGKHTCHMGVVKALKALAEVPPDKRSPDIKKTIETGAEYLLRHRIHKRSRDPSAISKPRFVHFGFPSMWETDALEMLSLLTKLGYRDERMREAVDLVLSKQDERGRWTLESTFNGRFQVAIERKGRPSKWITLNALGALQRFYG